MNLFVREDTSSYHKLVKRAQISKSFTILIHVAQCLSAHNFIVASVVSSNLGIEIAHKYRHVFLPCFIKDCLQLLVDGIFLFITSVIGGGIAFDDVQFDLDILCAELCCYYPGVNRFPSNKSFVCLQEYHQSYAFCVGGSLLSVSRIQHRFFSE